MTGSLMPLCILALWGTSRAAPIDIPLRTWIAVPTPEDNPAGPDTSFLDGYRGPAGACPNGECKHVRVAHNPDNGRIYFNGGDYDPGSGTNQMWSYSIADGDWILARRMSADLDRARTDVLAGIR